MARLPPAGVPRARTGRANSLTPHAARRPRTCPVARPARSCGLAGSGMPLPETSRNCPRPAGSGWMTLGHAHISTTMQIYTHVDEEARNDALTGLNELLSGGQ